MTPRGDSIHNTTGRVTRRGYYVDTLVFDDDEMRLDQPSMPDSSDNGPVDNCDIPHLSIEPESGSWRDKTHGDLGESVDDGAESPCEGILQRRQRSRPTALSAIDFEQSQAHPRTMDDPVKAKQMSPCEAILERRQRYRGEQPQPDKVRKVNSIGEAASILTPDQNNIMESSVNEYYGFAQMQTISGYGHQRGRHSPLYRPNLPRSPKLGPSTIATPNLKPAPSIIRKNARVKSVDLVYEGDFEEIIFARSNPRIPGKGATVAYAVPPKKQLSVTNASGSVKTPEDTTSPQNPSANKIQHTRKKSHPDLYNTRPASLTEKKPYEPTSPTKKTWRRIFGDEQTWPLKNKEAKRTATASQDNSGMDGAGYADFKMPNSELLANAPGPTKSEVPSHGGRVEQYTRSMNDSPAAPSPESLDADEDMIVGIQPVKSDSQMFTTSTGVHQPLRKEGSGRKSNLSASGSVVEVVDLTRE